MRRLELLAPAKNLECGIAAIDHGADAVYIGAPRFGARSAAGNSIDDIRALCHYAHQFAAKVYVTVNTIVYDDELDDTRLLLHQLAEAKVDAILVQDMAVMRMAQDIGLTIHASTQTDNRTPDKVRWLASLGFSRVVLARELSVDEIADIHQQVPEVELEVFVHGALCVSYSGQCYASQQCFGRSANRGVCAQFCRMKFDLLDADGQVLDRERYFLSLKDMNQSQHLGELIEAGATSFKIEGRLKDMAYVKNVTAANSELLNQYIARHHGEYKRSSLGRCTYTFKPDLRKTFNRGYTTYFLHGRQPDIASFDTPKAMGEYVGTVKEIRGNSFTVAGVASFSNGDGLCFMESAPLTSHHSPLTSHLSPLTFLKGFRVNRVEGNRLFPQKMPAGLRPGLRLYRNNDQEMERLLARPSAERKIPVKMYLRPTPDGYALRMSVLDGFPVEPSVEAHISADHQEAQKSPRENIIRQLTKLGGTPYNCDDIDIPAGFNYFIPSSLLSELRHQAVDLAQAMALDLANYQYGRDKLPVSPTLPSPPAYPLPYLYNVSNRMAQQFYQQQGVNVGEAFELSTPHPLVRGGGDAPSVPKSLLIMQCRHCLRYTLGRCVKHGGRKPEWKEPLSLRLGDGRTFRLEFDCKQCQMNVYAVYSS